jgi:hypothetical protein
MSVHAGGRGPGHSGRKQILTAAVASGTFLVGNNNASNTNIVISGNTSTGSAFQAATSGTANSVVIKGHSTNSNTANFYLCVYAATSESVWGGALLGQTAAQTPLGIGELRTVPLLAGVTITNGSFYAITVLPDSAMNHGGTSGLGISDRGFSNTYASGPAATAGTLGTNGTNTAPVYLTT